MNVKAVNQATQISFLLVLIIATFSALLGYIKVFLLINFDGGTLLDFFFNYITYLGDGLIWALIAILIVVFRRKYWLLALALAIFSTIITQLFKLYILKDQLRPNSAIADKSLFHTIKGVYLNDVGSFPSGHTATAFCFYFLACCLLNKKWIVPIGFIVTCLVAYSRVYQAQHFPIDVAGGITTAIISMYGAMFLQKKLLLKK